MEELPHTVLNTEDIAAFERFQPTIDALGPSQAARMSLIPIEDLPLRHPLRIYVEARQALRKFGFSGEPRYTVKSSDSRFNMFSE